MAINNVLIICPLFLMVSYHILSSSMVFQAEAETAERKLSCRLYPSLPKADRHEVSGHQGAAAQRLQSRSTDAQVQIYASLEDHQEMSVFFLRYWKQHRTKKNPKMRKKEVSGSSCIIPIFYISVLPLNFHLFFIYSGRSHRR